MSNVNANNFSIYPYSAILLVGPAGSGKSYLVHNIIHNLESEYTPDQVRYAIFDLKRSEFTTESMDYIKSYLLFDIVTDSSIGLSRLEQLANFAISRTTSGTNSPLIFIYIEESFMASMDQGRFDKALMTINQNASAANIKIIYSTANPRMDTVSKRLLHTFDLILAAPLSDNAYEYLEITKPPLADPYVFEVYRK